MPDQKDRKITLDIFDLANILSDALHERKFLAPHEHISVYDLEPAMESCGYYLTIERKGKKTEIRRAAR